MSCVPCPCDLFKITNRVQCTAVNSAFGDPPRLGQLYSGAYTTAIHVPDIIEGIPQMIQADLIQWGIKLALSIVFPWVIMFIILFIILGRKGIITYDMAIMLIVLVVILTIIALAYVYFETQTLLINFGPQVQKKLSDNWNTKKEQIVPQILDSYLNCSYCDSTTPGCDKSCGGICNACGRGLNTVAQELQNVEEILNGIVCK